ncbi:hypothetical protein ACRRTK_015369 [Alexandromys fortis]
MSFFFLFAKLKTSLPNIMTLRCTSLIPALGKQRQVDLCEFKTCQDCKVRPCLKTEREKGPTLTCISNHLCHLSAATIGLGRYTC